MTEINSGFTEDIFSRVVYEDECTKLDFEPNTCSSGAHEYGDNSCTYLDPENNDGTPAAPGGTYTTTLKPCDMPTGDVTPDTSNPSNQGPHGSVGNGGNTSSPTTCRGSRKCVPVDTDPVLTQQQIDQKNCDELNRIGNSAYAASAFITLNNNLNQNTETGFSLDIRPNFPYFAPIPKQLISDSEVSAGQNPYSFAYLHNHFIGKFEMFGHGDIHTLFRYANNFNPSLLPNYQFDNSLFVVFMTVRDNTYAIKIEDIDKLATIQQYFVDERAKIDFANDLEDVFKDANRDANGNRRSNPADADQEELAKAFLKFVNETNDFGIALYKANADDMLSQNAIWQKLSLDENGDLTPTNCN